MVAVIPARYDVTDVVLVRRRTRPPTALFVGGLVTGWVLDVVLVLAVVHLGVGALAATATGVLGYLLLPVPVVTLLREVWLRTHRDRSGELERQLGEHVPALRSWLDARLGEPAGLPPDLATTWLLRPEPGSRRDVLALAPEVGRRVGGAALTARHEVAGERVLLRLAVLPSAEVVADGPEPPWPA